MESIGIDVHKNESQICVLTQTGAVLERRFATRRERFAEVLGERPRARIPVEASTESEWVARCLEELGHQVVVADPDFAPMYATRTRKVKTDRRDARALAEACQLGAYRPAHRTSERQRHVRARLGVREALVRTRTGYISLVRARGRVRWLLVQAAVSTLRLKKPETAALRVWAERIALRRGRKIAVVALARRLAGILHAMMRDGTTYRPAPWLGNRSGLGCPRMIAR